MVIQKEGKIFVARYKGITAVGNSFIEAIDSLLNYLSSPYAQIL